MFYLVNITGIIPHGEPEAVKTAPLVKLKTLRLWDESNSPDKNPHQRVILARRKTDTYKPKRNSYRVYLFSQNIILNVTIIHK